MDRFVSIDGAGMSLFSRGVGSRRYRVTFTGPGGHSYGELRYRQPDSRAGPRHRGHRAVPGSARPKTTFNVGRIGGGTSVNAIAVRRLDGSGHAVGGSRVAFQLEAQMRTAVATGCGVRITGGAEGTLSVRPFS